MGLLFVKVKYNDVMFYKFVPEPHFTPDETRETIFLKISNVLKSDNFPTAKKFLDDEENNKPFFYQFNMAISVNNEDEYYEYCKKASISFINMIDLLKTKNETSRDFYELFSPFVATVYDEIKKTIDSYNPIYIFPKFKSVVRFEVLKDNLLSGKYLVLPYFELSESE